MGNGTYFGWNRCYTYLAVSLSHEWKAFHVCRIPVSDWMRPNTIVKIKTQTATQKVYHWAFFLRSNHHWDNVVGSASSKNSSRISSRSRQYEYLLTSRETHGKDWRPGSRPKRRSNSKLKQAGSTNGNRSAIVRMVSSKKSSGRTGLSGTRRQRNFRSTSCLHLPL